MFQNGRIIISTYLYLLIPFLNSFQIPSSTSTLKKISIYSSIANENGLPSVVKENQVINPNNTDNMVATNEQEKKNEFLIENMQIELVMGKEEAEKEDEEENKMKIYAKEKIISMIAEKAGKVNEERLAFPELSSGEVPRMFSNLNYVAGEDSPSKLLHASGSTLGAAALIAGTTVGAGVLGLPAATAPIGFLPSVGGLIWAWGYMVASGLLIAELSINRIGETGRTGVGLLDLYKSVLGGGAAAVGSAAYFFLHYAMMVAYIAQGGNNLNAFLTNGTEGIGQVLFATLAGLSIYLAKPSFIEKLNNILVLILGASFLGIIGIGVQTTDVTSLLSPANQHPEQVVNAFPIFFLALVYQNVVPTIVTQLEGDKNKITQAIVLGTLIPLVMFIAWNGVILGNVYSAPIEVVKQISEGKVDPISLLQNGSRGGENLSTLVGAFSQLALTTSLIGFVYGLIDALTDILEIPTQGPIFDKYKPLLFAGIFVPPLILSMANPDIFYNALEYGGAFGVSTLFLVLPPLMVWKKRYNEQESEITTLPLVPGGKIILGGMWKAAGTLIVEQTAEKLGIIDWLGQVFAQLKTQS